MTAVFLGAGSGMAFAGDEPAQQNVESQQNSNSTLTVPEIEVPDIEVPDIEVPDIEVPDIEVPDLDLPGVELPTGDTDNQGDDKSDNKGDEKDDHHGRHCGCDEHESDKKNEGKHPCPTSGHKSEDTGSEDSSPKVQSIASTSDDTQVESVSISPESDDTQVESASVDDTTPIGAADTGDGSSSPGFTPTFAPAASSSPLDDPLVLGGGAAAAALLGAYGVSVARRRTGAHRG